MGVPVHTRRILLRSGKDPFLALTPEATLARNAFGDKVVAHYLNAARIEIESFEAAVTDWERYRGFERL